MKTLQKRKATQLNTADGYSAAAHQEQSAFVLLIMPDVGRKPVPDSHYPLGDPYYICSEVSICGCPLQYPGNRMWKVVSQSPGGVFDGRVTGFPVSNNHVWNQELRVAFRDDRKAFRRKMALQWDRNLVRPLDLRGPQSAYAVITPDGLWHECVEPEPHDLLIGPREDMLWSLSIRPELTLSPLQLAWRSEVAALMLRHQGSWMLGLDAMLAPTPARICAQEAFSKQCAAQRGCSKGE